MLPFPLLEGSVKDAGAADKQAKQIKQVLCHKVCRVAGRGRKNRATRSASESSESNRSAEYKKILLVNHTTLKNKTEESKRLHEYTATIKKSYRAL